MKPYKYPPCEVCGNIDHLNWTEAFYSIGHKGGAWEMETMQVAGVLQQAGYAVGMSNPHNRNPIIHTIECDGIELIPYDKQVIEIGLDDPRSYLPSEIIELLDKRMPPRYCKP